MTPTLLAQRVADAVRRMGDSADPAVARVLAEGSAADLFSLFASADPAVARGAHECVMLRFAWIVAVVAQAFRFDGYARDDLVQCVFLDLPNAVRRAAERGEEITNPEGWIRRRAHLMARQLLREEHGTPVLDFATGAARRDAEGRVVRTHGLRVDVDAIDEGARDAAEAVLDQALEQASLRDGLRRALADLAREQPVGAEILRLQLNEGAQLNEIAARLGRTHGTVRNDVIKARRRLAAIIRERYPELLPESARGDEANSGIA